MLVNPYWPTPAIDPRKIETAWRPLFADTLSRISAEFDQRFPKVGGAWPPGRDWLPGQPPLFLAAPSGGAGTTTLLGTLLRRMEGKAVPIYLRPFRNPLGPWKALLRTVGEEMALPDRPRALYPWPEEPSRVQVFANEILSTLASRLVSQGRIRDSRLRSAVRFLRRHPSKILLEGLVPEWAQWLRLDFARIIPAAEELLSELGSWGDHPQNWLWAIHGLAVRTEDRVVQEACRRWVFGEPIDWAQAIRANLSIAPNEPATEPLTGEEDLCRRHMEDLLRLSGLSKPFLFAFDNVDAWGAEGELASAAGRLLEGLQAAPPAFLLLGGRLGPWNATVLPHWSERQRSLLSPLSPLREVERSEAAELLEERLERFEGPRSRVPSDWLAAAYRDRSSLPVRHLLLSCAIRWNEEHSLHPEPSSLSVRWLHDARLQWEMASLNLPWRWIAEWALLPLEAPADFPWQREDTGSLGLLCARRTLPEADLFLFPQPGACGTDVRAFQAFLEKAASTARGCGRTLESYGLVFEREESTALTHRSPPDRGSPELALLRVPTEALLDLAAAVSLSISFRREEGCPAAEEATRNRAEEILSSWHARLPASTPPARAAPRRELLSLPMIEAVRDAVRAKRTLPLSGLLERLPRQVSRKQVLSAAAILSEVQVRTGPTLEPLFCWQPS
ncbi:hypothetical protein [Methylacidimicrobium sp. B4]|uniref:hypothetical protein n=1 Tax=Methylacidimicrobium sp. B4 TaxID=2796139 RepID=UPI001A8F88EC|nr:hypothetical protein [Methylacidimicrobium sp. B4]QSR85575.1 hypothetical protein MacB4_04965 [Methylacidimicrobium sp. B4]